MAIDQATRGNLELMRTLAGERRGSLLAAIDRTVTAAGSRLLAQRLSAPLTDPEAIARRLDAVAASSTTRPRAPNCARACRRRPISPARWRVSPSAAAVRAISPPSATACWRRPISARDSGGAGGHPGAKSPRRCSPAAARTACSPRSFPARSPTSCRPSARRRLRARRLRREPRRDARACATNRAASSRRCRRDTPKQTGIRALKIRHNNVLGYFVEVTAQHGDKLLAAPLNATFIHRQTLAGQVRFTTTELGELEAKIASAADRALALELEIFERLAASVIGAERGDQGMRPRRSRALDVAERAGDTCRRARLCAPAGGRQPRLRDRRRPPSGGRAGAGARRRRRSSPTTAICRRRRRRVEIGRPHLADHRPEHGGQVHLPAAERADRDAGADGQLRAGQARPYRRRRPPVLARRRRRRSGARPLDLHGRDGRDRRDPQSGGRARAGHPRRDRPRHRDLRRPVDRLGDGRASARRQSLPRAVRHAFPRTDRARRAADAAAQRDDASEGMAGRGRVPARSRRPAPPTVPTASRWRSSPACRRA